MRPVLALCIGALVLSLVRTPSASAETRPIPLERSPVTSHPPDGIGAGAYVVGPADEVTPDQRRSVQRRLDASVAALRAAEGSREPAGAPATHVRFDWPLRLAAGIVEPGYYGISNFVDQNPAFPNLILDWNCGTRTYDLASGYNHSGTDIFLWPFPWLKMDGDTVEIIAAAAGTIVAKDDGNYDRNCAFNDLTPNAVYVMHSDGSIAWYLHMKSGSVTAKSVGQSVALGEYLGRVGSSGSSTGPHLHFEVHDPSNALIDPYFVSGGCNALNPDTWWNAQPSYYDPAVTKLITGAAPFTDNGCPNDETTHEQGAFVRGTTVYFTSFYRDLLNGQSTTLTARRPDDSVFCSFPFTSNSTYSAAYVYMYCTIGAGEQLGTWHFEVALDNQTYSQPFGVGLTTTTSTTTSSTTSTTFSTTSTTSSTVPTTSSTLPTTSSTTSSTSSVIPTTSSTTSSTSSSTVPTTTPTTSTTSSTVPTTTLTTSSTVPTTTSTTSSTTATVSTTTATSSTTTTTLALAQPCGAMPAGNCRLAPTASTNLLLRNAAGEAADQLDWAWGKGAATAPGDFKDPTHGSARYLICVYDASGNGQPILTAAVPAGGTCGRKSCWKAAGTSAFVYRNKVGRPAGITAMTLMAGSAGKAKIRVKGKGTNLPTPTLPLALPVVVQLVISDGSGIGCWQTTYPTAATNTGSVFKSKRTKGRARAARRL